MSECGLPTWPSPLIMWCVSRSVCHHRVPIWCRRAGEGAGSSETGVSVLHACRHFPRARACPLMRPAPGATVGRLPCHAPHGLPSTWMNDEHGHLALRGLVHHRCHGLPPPLKLGQVIGSLLAAGQGQRCKARRRARAGTALTGRKRRGRGDQALGQCTEPSPMRSRSLTGTLGVHAKRGCSPAGVPDQGEHDDADAQEDETANDEPALIDVAGGCGIWRGPGPGISTRPSSCQWHTSTQFAGGMV